MEQDKLTPPLPDRLLREREVSDLLGYSRAQTYRLMQRGVLPVVRLAGGKSVRVPYNALMEWIKQNTKGGRE
jgi:excisionase family DNA binding protein